MLTRVLPELERDPLSPEDRYDGPVLFIAGGRSRYVQPGDWAAIHAHFPAADVEVIRESGHNPHMDARETFVALVTQKKP